MQRTCSWSKRNRRVPRIADLLSHDSLLAHVFEIAVEYLTHVVQGHMTLTMGMRLWPSEHFGLGDSFEPCRWLPYEPSQEAFAFFSAQRFFIASDSFFLPAGVSRPRLFGTAVLRYKLFARRSAQRRFIASDKRRRPSGVMLPRLLRAAFRVGPLPLTPTPSSKAVIAPCIFSLSRFNSAMILSRSTMVLLD